MAEKVLSLVGLLKDPDGLGFKGTDDEAAAVLGQLGLAAEMTGSTLYLEALSSQIRVQETLAQQLALNPDWQRLSVATALLDQLRSWRISTLVPGLKDVRQVPGHDAEMILASLLTSLRSSAQVSVEAVAGPREDSGDLAAAWASRYPTLDGS